MNGSYVMLITVRVAAKMVADGALKPPLVWAGGFSAAGHCIIAARANTREGLMQQADELRPQYQEDGQSEFLVTIWYFQENQ